MTGGLLSGLIGPAGTKHRISGLVFMEFIRPFKDWSELPPIMVGNWQKFRDPNAGRKLLIDENFFTEGILPQGQVRQLSQEEMDVYRKPFLRTESREAIYRLPNELPVAGQPAHTAKIIQDYIEWLFATEKPKLFFWATPGGIISEEQTKELIEKLKDTKAVCVGAGIHYLQEDNPHLIGRELADWLSLVSDKV